MIVAELNCSTNRPHILLYYFFLYLVGHKYKRLFKKNAFSTKYTFTKCLINRSRICTIYYYCCYYESGSKGYSSLQYCDL